MPDSVYKPLSQTENMRTVQRVVSQELFGNKRFISIPYNNSNEVTIKTSSVPATDTNFYNKITYVNKSGSSSTYFSYVDATSASYGSISSGSNSGGLSYWNFTRMMYPTNDKFKINDGTYTGTTNEMTVVSINREYYKDGIKPDNFAVLLNTSSVASLTSTVTGNAFSQDNGILPLFAGNAEFTSRLGDKRYLYPVSSSVATSTVIYDSDIDQYAQQTELDTTKPYGELIVDYGLVILYRDIIKQDYASLNDTDVGAFIAGVGGANFIQLNGTIITSNIKLNEFNFTTNPTFFDDNSPEIIKEQFRVNPVTYVTGVGVYNENNELIAFGRPSKPLKNSFSDEIVFKIELNY